MGTTSHGPQPSSGERAQGPPVQEMYTWSPGRGRGGPLRTETQTPHSARWTLNSATRRTNPNQVGTRPGTGQEGTAPRNAGAHDSARVSPRGRGSRPGQVELYHEQRGNTILDGGPTLLTCLLFPKRLGFEQKQTPCLKCIGKRAGRSGPRGVPAARLWTHGQGPTEGQSLGTPPLPPTQRSQSRCLSGDVASRQPGCPGNRINPFQVLAHERPQPQV